MQTAIQLVIGLGNPGSQYAATRHNAGVWMMSILSQQYQFRLQKEKKFFGECAVTTSPNQKNYWLVPTTFMNCSGQAVQALVNFYKIPLDAILIMHDELDLSLGDIRLKWGGGHAGHNGLRHIIQVLGSANFWRLRIGIGHPGKREEVLSFVLGVPNKQELHEIQEALTRASRIFPALLAGKFELAMHSLYTKE